MKNLIRISLAVAALVGAQVVGAQTTPDPAPKTITLSVTLSGGDRDSADGLQVQEGDRITITTTPNNFDAGNAASTGCLSFMGTATSGTARSDATGVDFYGTADPSSSNVEVCGRDRYRAIVSAGVAVSHTFQIADDTVSEPDETINLALTGAFSVLSGGVALTSITAGTPSSIAVTILASDPATVSIARTGAATLNEGQSAEFTVTMSAANAAAVTVPYTVAGSGAYNVASGDQSGSVEIPAGDTTATLSLALPVSDTLGDTDPDQTITVTLTADDPGTADTDEGPTAATNGGTVTRTTTASGQSAAVMVNFVDTARTLTVTGPATFAETDANAETGNYTITLAGTAFASATTVTWTLTHGTTENADFVAATDRTGTVSFATSDADGATKTFTLTVAGDDLNEAGETFSVQISVADSVTDGGTATGSPAMTTITDDDPITASLSAAAVDEGDSVTVNLDHTPTRPVTVAYTLGRTAATDDTDAANADLTIATRRVTFPANTAPTAMNLLTVTDDDLTEPAETFTVAITSAQISGAYGDATGDSETYTIAANDPIAAVITAADTDVTEGGNAVLSVDLGAVAGGAVMVAYSVAVTPSTSDRDATVTGAGVDFTDANSGSITIAAGQRRGTITLAIVDDTVNESEETFQVTIAAAGITGGGAATIMSGGTTVFTIAESDPFTFSISADQSITEADTGDRAVTAEFTVTLSGGASTSTAAGDTEVVFSVADASTAASSDYTISPATRVTFDTDADEPDLTQTITVTVTADDMNEAAETVIIELSVVESRGGAGGLSFTVDSGFAADGNTAGRSSATLTINDDDRINLAIDNADSTARRVEEGDSVTFEVEVSGGAPSSPVSFRYAISGVSAADYHDPNGGLITLPATTTANAMVNFGHAIVINVDAQAEPDETLTLRITDAGAHTADAPPATFTAAQRARVNFGGPTASESVTINANPAAARSLAVTVDDASVAEGDTVTFTVTPSAAFDAAATLDYEVIHGTTGPTVTAQAASRNDFTDAERSGTVSFAATDAMQTFTIDINDDNVNEPDQTFTVRVTAAMPAAQGGTVAGISPVVTIAANDPVTFRMITNDTASSESSSRIDATVSIDPPGGSGGGASAARLTAPLTIPYTLSGTATRGVDYTASGEVVVTGELNASGHIMVTPIDDTLNEADETVIITLDHARATCNGCGEVTFRDQAGDGAVTITITDNDAVTATFASATATANEGETVTLTLNLDTASSGPITAVYTVMAAGTNPPEFTDPGSTSSPGASTRTGQIIIPAGQRSGEIVLYINTDPNTDTGTGTLTVSNTTLTANYGGGLSNMLTAASTDAVVTVTFRAIPRNFSVAADSTTVTEGGSVEFTITLTADGANPPTTRATVGWAAMGGGVTGRFGSVTLANGGMQSVRIAIPQDNDLEDPERLMFLLTPPAGALCFGDPIASCNTGIGMGSVTVMVNNDDTAGVTVTPTALNVPEGDAAAYSVRLNARPGMGNTVTITPSIASGGDAHVSIATTALTFDNDNWNRAQSVTVTSTDTAMRGQRATINHAVSASLTGSEYSSATAAPVAVTIVEPRTAEKLHRTVLPQLARAVAGAQMNAIAERAAAAADGGAGGGYGFNLNGANTLDGAAAANMRALAGAADDADIDWKEALRDTDFSLQMGAGHGHGGGGADLAFWGGSSYSDFAGEDRDTDWDGDMFSLYTGFDARVRPDMRAGLMLSYVDSESDYSTVAGRSVESGEYEMEMTTMSPYLNWRRHDGNAWVTVGYGSGEVEVRPDNDNPDRLNEVNMQNFGIGGVKTLSRAGAREVRIKADVFEANAEVEGNATGGVEGDINVDVHRVRIALESRRTRALAGGAQLTPALEIGARHDGGDGRTGGGMELGGKLHYHDPGLGLTVEARARYLVGHSAAGTRDWGIGGLARLAPGADGQGLAVTLTPAYGATESGADDLWKNGLAAARTSDSTDAAVAKNLAARMDAEIGYGMPVDGVFGFGDGAAGLGDGGMLTPYSALRLGDSKRDYRFGVKWTSADRLALNLSARRLDGGAADNIVALEGRLDF